MTILAKPAILSAHRCGDVLIEPFVESNVKNCSVDVTLGCWYWLETSPVRIGNAILPTGQLTTVVDEDALLNPYDECSVMRAWGEVPMRAQPIRQALPGIPLNTLVIPLHPGQNILAHTHEFIGGTDQRITTMLKARSSIGRNQITICRCAGWGDIGFCNRYVLEISNHGRRTVVLVVGRRIGQVVFLETTGIHDIQDNYHHTGKYQTESLKGRSFAELEERWSPHHMLPQMWRDQESYELPSN